MGIAPPVRTAASAIAARSVPRRTERDAFEERSGDACTGGRHPVNATWRSTQSLLGIVSAISAPSSCG